MAAPDQREPKTFSSDVLIPIYLKGLVDCGTWQFSDMT